MHDFLKYYERELTFTREMAAEFARKYPKVAARLLLEPDKCEDPHVERLIENGATLQIGIGGIPNLVAQLLANGKKGDFGIHTEMMVDGIMHLHGAGKITNHKGVYDGLSVATFAAGSNELYRWMHRNPEVRMLPVAQVNDPAIIRRDSGQGVFQQSFIQFAGRMAGGGRLWRNGAHTRLRRKAPGL